MLAEFYASKAISGQDWVNDRSFLIKMQTGKEKAWENVAEYTEKRDAYTQWLASKRKKQLAGGERNSKKYAAIGVWQRGKIAVYIVVGLIAFYIALQNRFFIPQRANEIDVFTIKPTATWDTQVTPVFPRDISRAATAIAYATAFPPTATATRGPVAIGQGKPQVDSTPLALGGGTVLMLFLISFVSAILVKAFRSKGAKRGKSPPAETEQT